MDFPAAFDFGSKGGKLRVRNTEEIISFADKCVNTWSWIQQTLNSIPNYNSTLDKFHQAYAKFINHISSVRRNIEQGNVRAAFDTLNSYFADGDAFPVPETENASLVIGVRERLGNRAALGSLGMLLKFGLESSDPEQLRGALIAYEKLENTGGNARRAVQDSLAALLRRLDREQARAEERADQLDEKVAQLEERRRRQFHRLVQAGRAARVQFSGEISSHVAEIRAAAEEAVQSIRATEKVYSEHMGLKGPVTYWSEKAKSHRRNRNIALLVGLMFATIVVLYAILYGIDQVDQLVITIVNRTKIWQTSYIVLTAIVFC